MRFDAHNCLCPHPYNNTNNNNRSLELFEFQSRLESRTNSRQISLVIFCCVGVLHHHHILSEENRLYTANQHGLSA
jgi:hypothetical protein